MRNPNSLIWTSSYDRGLNHLLEIWPEVLKEVPQAQLYITYGWNLFNSVYGNESGRPNPERIAWRDQLSQQMNQKGISHLGRVGQKQIIEILKTCGIWAYPTDFDEISCISAMKAQIYGAIPVTMAKAALKETVKFGQMVEGDINDPKVKKEYTKALISWLNPDKQKKERAKMMEESKKLFSWAGVAKEWEEEFKKPKVYSQEWATELFDSFPKELQDETYRSYSI